MDFRGEPRVTVAFPIFECEACWKDTRLGNPPGAFCRGAANPTNSAFELCGCTFGSVSNRFMDTNYYYLCGFLRGVDEPGKNGKLGRKVFWYSITFDLESFETPTH